MLKHTYNRREAMGRKPSRARLPRAFLVMRTRPKHPHPARATSALASARGVRDMSKTPTMYWPVPS
jgi:hypothetical protein